jgi:hypothetical protein
MSQFSFQATASPAMGSGRRTSHVRTRDDRNPGFAERPKWEVLSVLRHYPNDDIDWYRRKHGKAEGERRFFGQHAPETTDIVRGNMLLGNGSSALWQCLLGNGTSSANSALGSGPTYYNNSQAQLYVGDGGITSGSGTVSVTGASGSVTFASSQTGLQGKYFVVAGDSSAGIYTVTGGSGTSWTISPVYGGTTAGSASWSYLAAETHSQTAMVGSSNLAHQSMDSTFPANLTSAQYNAITGATNASPIVLTISSGDISTNDIVQVFEVAGNTASNGMFVANPASTSSVTLLGSTGNGSYTYGGIVTKRTVFKCQSTFGPSAANFAWWEWGIANGTGGNQIFLNRKVFNGGTKSGGTTSFQVGIGLG